MIISHFQLLREKTLVITDFPLSSHPSSNLSTNPICFTFKNIYLTHSLLTISTTITLDQAIFFLSWIITISQLSSCSHACLSWVFSQKQPERYFKNIRQMISFLCSKPSSSFPSLPIVWAKSKLLQWSIKCHTVQPPVIYLIISPTLSLAFSPFQPLASFLPLKPPAFAHFKA